MASKADTLKIAQADMETVQHKLSRIRGGSYLGYRPENDVVEVIRLLEKTARRMRKAWPGEVEDE